MFWINQEGICIKEFITFTNDQSLVSYFDIDQSNHIDLLLFTVTFVRSSHQFE